MICSAFRLLRRAAWVGGFLFLVTWQPRAEAGPGELLIGEMNCVACHDAPGTVKARLASRASPRLDPAHAVRVTPQWLRAFLENPQATQPGTLMPDLLAALEAPARTVAAEELTHYLVAARGAAKEAPAAASAAAMATGKALYHTVGCVACHAPEELPADKANNAEASAEFARLRAGAVPLGALEKKFTVAELAAFLRDPLKSRPGGRMPSSKLKPEEARAIAIYLLRAQAPAGATAQLPGVAYEYYEAELPELPEFDRMQAKTAGSADTFTLGVAERKNDFALRFRGTLLVPKDGEYEFYTKSDDGSRLLIDDQLVVENGGIHPAQERAGKVTLTKGGHAIQVVYFDGGGEKALQVSWKGPGLGKREIEEKSLSHKGHPMRPVGDAPFAVDAEKAARGKALFATLNCAACHKIDDAGRKARPLAELRGRQPAGCLSSKPQPNGPHFTLTDRQRAVILAQLGNQAELGEAQTPEQQITRTLTALNCYACHARERRGGAEGLRRDYFTTLGEMDLGDEGRIPPTLHGIGAKLRPEWIKSVLAEGGVARPYMAVRMPQYGPGNIGHLPELFAKADARAEARPQPDVFAEGVGAEANKFGGKLIGVGGLTCIACHNLDGNKSLGVPALDLASSGQRLKWDWFRRYLLDPQALRPGTRMPPFWPGGVAVNQEVLGGDAEKQIFAIWSYLARKNFTDLPPGLVQGQQELIAEREAVIYRNFIEGAGTRAIGVGYPEKANLAFDANEQRLALVWQGPFIDAAKHRTGRGQGFQKPLGTGVLAGPAGPPFARLESESAPWPKEAGAAAGWQFHGYTLDAQQRPIFRYGWEGLVIEDFPIAVTTKNEPGLRRTITLRGTATGAPLYFRAALAEKIAQKGGGYAVGDQVTMRFPGARPLLRPSEGKTELLVPVTFKDGEAKLVQEIAW